MQQSKPQLACGLLPIPARPVPVKHRCSEYNNTMPAPQDSSSDDEALFGVGVGDLSLAVDDDSEATVAEPSASELEAFRALELACLEGLSADVDAGAALEVARGWYEKIAAGAYASVVADALLKQVVERPPLKVTAINDRCQALAAKRGHRARARAELTAAGAACLRLYQQANYSGPLPSEASLRLVAGYAPTLLDVGGDAPSSFAVASGALTLALALLEAASDETPGACDWWLLRAKTLHVRCLVTGTHSVCGTFVAAMQKHASQARLWLSDASSDTRALLELEVGLAEHFLDEPERGRGAFRKAADITRLNLTLEGSLGKRTKFQVDSKPQLRVAEAACITAPAEVFPKGPSLNEDSVLLEDVAFDDKKRRAAIADPRRAALTSCVALALCLDVKNTNPDDGLTNDQMRPYVAFALATPVDWLVHSAALIQRCRLEAASVYSADRAALQLEVLANQHITTKTGDACASDRIAFAAAVDYPSRWELDGEVASAMARLGAFVSAAERYAKIHEWDLVIELYAAAGRREEALVVLNRELLLKPDHPRLLCALGDLRDDATLHEKAWNKSGRRDWRAARSLGRRHMNSGRWPEACAWFYETIKARPQASQSWFDLGCCRMRVAEAASDAEDRKAQLGKAARAFSRCVQHEPDCGDAWANLAACRLRCGQTAMAKNALERAVATRPEDWRLWENLARCACMSKRPAEAMHALNRLLDLASVSKRSVGATLDVLLRVMELVDEESDDSFNSQRARDVLDELCLRLDTEAPAGADRASATLWSALAERAEDSVTCRVRRAKAVRAYLNSNDLERDAKLLEGLAKVALELSTSMDDATLKERASTALLLRSVAARVEASTCAWDAKAERVAAITGAAAGLEA